MVYRGRRVCLKMLWLEMLHWCWLWWCAGLKRFISRARSKSRKTCCWERINIWVFLVSICLFCFFFLCSHWFATIIFCAKVCVLFSLCKTYLIILSLISHIKIWWNHVSGQREMGWIKWQIYVWGKNLLMGIWLIAHYGLILHIKWYSFPSVSLYFIWLVAFRLLRIETNRITRARFLIYIDSWWWHCLWTVSGKMTLQSIIIESAIHTLR